MRGNLAPKSKSYRLEYVYTPHAEFNGTKRKAAKRQQSSKLFKRATFKQNGCIYKDLHDQTRIRIAW